MSKSLLVVSFAAVLLLGVSVSAQEAEATADEISAEASTRGKKCKNPDTTYECVSKCDVTTCDQVGYGALCDTSTAAKCKYKCVCRGDLVMNSEGDCVSRLQCSKCGADPNARFGCGTYCGNLCSNYKKKDEIACTFICLPNACECKEGYVRDNMVLPPRCVKPKDCAYPTVGGCLGDPNAMIGCSNYCGHQCSDYNLTGIICPDFCIKDGCACTDGYVFSAVKGYCVTPDQC